jgi:hypothetical protein
MRKLRVDVAATDAAGFFFAGPPPASRIAFVFRASAIGTLSTPASGP